MILPPEFKSILNTLSILIPNQNLYIEDQSKYKYKGMEVK